MKKFYSLVLASCLFLTACGNSQSGAPASSSGVVSESAQSQAVETIETDKKLLTVEITFPASFFEGEDMSGFDTESYAKENGFEKAILNDDGSITVIMSKRKHEELVEETKASLEKNLNEMVGAAETDFIKEITSNNNFTEIKAIVDKEKYDQNALFAAFIPLTVYIQTSFYHTINDTDPVLEFSFVDQADNSVIDSVKYPDELSERNN